MRSRKLRLRMLGNLGILPLILLSAVGAGGCRSSALEHWTVGQLELRSGQTDRAVASLEKSKAIDPDFAPSYLALAAAKARTGDLPAVAENLEEYLRRNPDHHAAELYLAECRFNMGDEASARKSFETYLRTTERTRNEHAGRRIHAHQRLAELAARRDDRFEEDLHAGAALLEEAARSPAPAAESDRDLKRQQTERLVAALQRLKRAKSQKPTDAEVKRHLSTVLAMLGEEPPSNAAPTVAEQSLRPPTAATSP